MNRILNPYLKPSYNKRAPSWGYFCKQSSKNIKFYCWWTKDFHFMANVNFSLNRMADCSCKICFYTCPRKILTFIYSNIYLSQNVHLWARKHLSCCSLLRNDLERNLFIFWSLYFWILVWLWWFAKQSQPHLIVHLFPEQKCSYIFVHC